jgi:hypothetical protein
MMMRGCPRASALQDGHVAGCAVKRILADMDIHQFYKEIMCNLP